MPVPIGILTRDRVSYLDVTLRSLSATHLPANISVTIFDDKSKNQKSLQYYSTNNIIDVDYAWPKQFFNQQDLGLFIVKEPDVPVTGVKDKVNVITIAEKSVGVRNASCYAINYMFDKHKDAEGVLLLQDDVIFNIDWYTRLVELIKTLSTHAKPLGIIAGIHLNKGMSPKADTPNFVPGGITAQCVYITRKAYLATDSYFTAAHAKQNKFDDSLQRAVKKQGFLTGCIFPFICQHIGVRSLVRKNKYWFNRPKGRIGYAAHPPYVIANKVKNFINEEN